MTHLGKYGSLESLDYGKKGAKMTLITCPCATQRLQEEIARAPSEPRKLYILLRMSESPGK